MDDTLETITAPSHLERVVARYLAGLAYSPDAATAKAHTLLADIPPDCAPTQALKLIDDRIRHWLAAMVARTGITVHPYSAAPRVALLTLEIGKHWPDQLLLATPLEPKEIGPISLIPHWQTMRCASSVALLRSPEAALLNWLNMTSSAARPPIIMRSAARQYSFA